eukprot:scaffold21083_cov65-Phaeocystis_antarctica.AAC.3
MLRSVCRFLAEFISAVRARSARRGWRAAAESRRLSRPRKVAAAVARSAEFISAVRARSAARAAGGGGAEG